MNARVHNPAGIAQPASRYAQGMSVAGATQWLEVSGQVGIHPDGTPAGDSAAQMKRCFQNIAAVLQDAGMDVGNLVKITAFITSADDVALFRSVRDEMLDGHVCASTLLVVSALANPAWSVEIEAVAAA